MSAKAKSGLPQETIKMMRKFVNIWGQSLDLRIRAAKLYFKVANENLSAKFAFHRMPEFSHWSPAQWRVVFFVGAGSISTKYLDIHPYTISLALLERNVSIEDQDKIFEEGLQVVVGNSLSTISVKNLTAPQIKQAFDKDGSYRDEDAQKVYIIETRKAKAKKNVGKLERVSKFKYKARTSVIIDKTVVKQLLLNEECPMLSVAELEKIMDELNSRGN
jgi:hypothetical protein